MENHEARRWISLQMVTLNPRQERQEKTGKALCSQAETQGAEPSKGLERGPVQGQVWELQGPGSRQEAGESLSVTVGRGRRHAGRK